MVPVPGRGVGSLPLDGASETTMAGQLDGEIGPQGSSMIGQLLVNDDS